MPSLITSVATSAVALLTLASSSTAARQSGQYASGVATYDNYAQQPYAPQQYSQYHPPQYSEQYHYAPSRALQQRELLEFYARGLDLGHDEFDGLIAREAGRGRGPRGPKGPPSAERRDLEEMEELVTREAGRGRGPKGPKGPPPSAERRDIEDIGELIAREAGRGRGPRGPKGPPSAERRDLEDIEELMAREAGRGGGPRGRKGPPSAQRRDLEDMEELLARDDDVERRDFDEWDMETDSLYARDAELEDIINELVAREAGRRRPGGH